MDIELERCREDVADRLPFVTTFKMDWDAD